MAKAREEISEAILKRARELSETITSDEFDIAFGHLVKDEAATLAKAKFEVGHEESKPLTIEEAERKIYLLLGKEFGK
jgi:hypothetical protein